MGFPSKGEETWHVCVRVATTTNGSTCHLLGVEFRFEANDLRPTKTEKRFMYDVELSDVSSLFRDVCYLLNEAGATFAVSGFGDAHWPVDVQVDFAILLEQLPAALRAISLGQSFQLDLFEQGVERFLTFEPVDDQYEVRCKSLTRWQPTREVEFIDTRVIERQLKSVRDRFLDAVAEVAPTAAKHIWFERWLAGVLP